MLAFRALRMHLGNDMRMPCRWSGFLVLVASIAGAACRDASAPIAERPLAPGTFESSHSGAVVATLVGRAQHILYPGGSPLFIYLSDTSTATGLGNGGLVLERLAGAPIASGAFPAQLWGEASSGPVQNFAISSFLVVGGAATSIEFTSLIGTVTIDSVGAGVLVGRLEARGPASLAGSNAAPAPVTIRARFRSRLLP